MFVPRTRDFLTEQLKKSQARRLKIRLFLFIKWLIPAPQNLRLKLLTSIQHLIRKMKLRNSSESRRAIRKQLSYSVQDAAIIEKAASLRAEYVVAVVGKVERRSGAVNDKIATGEIEVIPSELRVLSESQTPPFPIEENSKTKEDIRLKYRYLDLRRPDLQRNLRMKSQVMTLTRQFFSDEGFLEVKYKL